MFGFGKGQSRWHPAAIFLTSLLVGSAMACGGEEIPGETPAATPISGAVLDVSDRSLTQIESLTVRDGSGATWKFVAENYAGMTPSHLRQHMVLGQQITVSFHEANGALVIDDIRDHAPAGDAAAQP